MRKSRVRAGGFYGVAWWFCSSAVEEETEMVRSGSRGYWCCFSGERGFRERGDGGRAAAGSGASRCCSVEKGATGQIRRRRKKKGRRIVAAGGGGLLVFRRWWCFAGGRKIFRRGFGDGEERRRGGVVAVWGLVAGG
ncbi:hypothetical protein HAX54_036377 [Datura stramonium]|uniref:Uncharacterized protein n=1 Tax=Datura stramonium TaxID=4076 RepID=A0ABS8Y7D9_DATST|nr:hypothetical protein [Datura stramonium]